MSFKKVFRICSVLYFGMSACLFSVRASAAQEDGLYVFAAASLTDALQEAGEQFEAAYGTPIFFNFAGSNTLRIQIEKGAMCDVFVSADIQNTEKLVKQGLVLESEVQKLLASSLVVITQADNPLKINSLADLAVDNLGYISLADPQTVPAGIYAREALATAGIWDELKGSVVPALDVRAAMAQVANGNAPVGIVYRTDAASSDAVRVSYRIPAHLHSGIVYPACIIKGAAKRKLSQRFLAFLKTEAAKDIFRKYGFESL